MPCPSSAHSISASRWRLSTCSRSSITTSSTSAAPTAAPRPATRSSTTSYASSTTRARGRSSSTTAPSRLDVGFKAPRLGLEQRAREADVALEMAKLHAQAEGESARAAPSRSRHVGGTGRINSEQEGGQARERSSCARRSGARVGLAAERPSTGRPPDNSEERRRRVRPPRLRRRDRVPALRQKWLGLLVGHHQRGGLLLAVAFHQPAEKTPLHERCEGHWLPGSW